MNTRERDSATNEPISAHRLHSLTPAQVLTIDRALTSLGPFGEVRIVKAKGRVRFIEPQINEATRTVPLKLEVPNRDGRLRAQLFELGVVSEERIAENGSWMLHVDMPRDTAERLARLPGAEGETVRRQLLEARDRA